MNKQERTARQIVLAAVSAICALLPSVSAADEGVAGKHVFTDGEIRIILSHGPWPVPVRPDPTNRVSGKPDAIEFGTRLFFDARLSGTGIVEYVLERLAPGRRRPVQLMET